MKKVWLLRTIGIVVLLFTLAGCSGHGTQSAFIIDEADVVSGNVSRDVNRLLSEVWRTTNIDVVIATVYDASPLSVEQYADELFSEMDLDDGGRNILVLIEIDDVAVSIKVGEGLDAVVTGLQCDVIINDIMAPALDKGDYDLAVSSCAVMLAKILQAEYGVEYDLK